MSRKPRKKPGPKLSRGDSQARGDAAFVMRAQGFTLDQICARLGFPHRSSAFNAIRAAMRRSSVDAAPAAARAYLLRATRDTTRKWSEKFDAAYKAKDVEGMRRAHEALAKDRDTQARLTGAYAAERVNVAAVDEQTFAEQAMALLEAVGDGPLREAAGLPQLSAAPPDPGKDTCPGTNGWCNISSADVSGPYREPEGYQPYQPPSESGPEWRTEPSTPDPEPVDDQNGGEEVVEVVAELVPLPPAQRRVKAPIDSNGVPYDRGGIHRRLPGPSSRGYDALRYSGWSEIIHPTDD